VRVRKFCVLLVSHSTCRSSQNAPLLSLSVEERDPNHAALYLPHGAVEESFSREMLNTIDTYILYHGPSWYIQCNPNSWARKRYPILVTSSWLAKSFACATYIQPSHKAKMGRHAELTRVPNQDLMQWDVDDGIYYMTAPLDIGYDKDGQLLLPDKEHPPETQCCAISAFQICPESFMERSGALLSPSARRRSNVTVHF